MGRGVPRQGADSATTGSPCRRKTSLEPSRDSGGEGGGGDRRLSEVRREGKARTRGRFPSRTTRREMRGSIWVQEGRAAHLTRCVPWACAPAACLPDANIVRNMLESLDRRARRGGDLRTPLPDTAVNRVSSPTPDVVRRRGDGAVEPRSMVESRISVSCLARRPRGRRRLLLRTDRRGMSHLATARAARAISRTSGPVFAFLRDETPFWA